MNKNELEKLAPNYRVGVRLSMYLEEKSIRRRAAAKLIDKSQGYFNQICRGEKNLSADTLLRILFEFTSLNANWLLRGVGEMEIEANRDNSIVSEPLPVYLSQTDSKITELERRVHALEKRVLN